MSQFFISCKESKIENNRSFYGCFNLGPFEPSQSITIANALRRTLLSELYGLSIVSVEIEGATHEYSNLTGVKDSVLDILLNLKEIILKKNSNYQTLNLKSLPVIYSKKGIIRGRLSKEINQEENQGITAQAQTGECFEISPELQTRGTKSFRRQSSQINYRVNSLGHEQAIKPQIGYLKARGPGLVRASNLRLPPFIQCVDPDQYIATLAEDGFLNIKFIIQYGNKWASSQTGYLSVANESQTDFRGFQKLDGGSMGHNEISTGEFKSIEKRQRLPFGRLAKEFTRMPNLLKDATGKEEELRSKINVPEFNGSFNLHLKKRRLILKKLRHIGLKFSNSYINMLTQLKNQHGRFFRNHVKNPKHASFKIRCESSSIMHPWKVSFISKQIIQPARRIKPPLLKKRHTKVSGAKKAVKNQYNKGAEDLAEDLDQRSPLGQDLAKQEQDYSAEFLPDLSSEEKTKTPLRMHGERIWQNIRFPGINLTTGSETVGKKSQNRSRFLTSDFGLSSLKISEPKNNSVTRIGLKIAQILKSRILSNKLNLSNNNQLVLKDFVWETPNKAFRQALQILPRRKFRKGTAESSREISQQLGTVRIIEKKRNLEANGLQNGLKNTIQQQKLQSNSMKNSPRVFRQEYQGAEYEGATSQRRPEGAEGLPKLDKRLMPRNFRGGFGKISKVPFRAKHPISPRVEISGRLSVKSLQDQPFGAKAQKIVSEKRTMQIQKNWNQKAPFEKTVGSVFLNSNPLTIDAIFNPITKVNYIIEVNDFKTAQNSFQSSLESSELFEILNIVEGNEILNRRKDTHLGKSFNIKENDSFREDNDDLKESDNFSRSVSIQTLKLSRGFQLENILKIKHEINSLKKEIPKHNIILEIWTNGSIHPRDAIYEGLKNLVKLFSKLNKINAFIINPFLETSLEDRQNNLLELKANHSQVLPESFESLVSSKELESQQSGKEKITTVSRKVSKSAVSHPKVTLKNVSDLLPLNESSFLSTYMNPKVKNYYSNIFSPKRSQRLAVPFFFKESRAESALGSFAVPAKKKTAEDNYFKNTKDSAILNTPLQDLAVISPDSRVFRSQRRPFGAVPSAKLKVPTETKKFNKFLKSNSVSSALIKLDSSYKPKLVNSSEYLIPLTQVPGELEPITKDVLALLISDSKLPSIYNVAKLKGIAAVRKILGNLDIGVLNLSLRSYTCLKRLNINTVDELINFAWYSSGKNPSFSCAKHPKNSWLPKLSGTKQPIELSDSSNNSEQSNISTNFSPTVSKSSPREESKRSQRLSKSPSDSLKPIEVSTIKLSKFTLEEIKRSILFFFKADS